MKDIVDVMNGNKAIPFEALDTVAQSMVNKINATTSEVIYDANGQHFVDKANKNHLMTLNSSGLLLSTDGGAQLRQQLLQRVLWRIQLLQVLC